MNSVNRTGLLLVMLAALSGCATAVGSGYGQGGQNADGRSYAEARADNQITAAVNTLLVRDKRVQAMDIDVSSYNGVVTLSGSVAERSAARYAEELAASVDGVEQVINRLQIRR